MQKPDSSGVRLGRARQCLRRARASLIAFVLSALLSLGTPANLYSQIAILQVRVVEGEGAVHAAGSKATRPIVVEVTDETGNPVPGATVSFRLPEEGATGIFASGIRTDLVTTDMKGRAALPGLQFGRTLGQMQIRITAAKGEARAGTLSTQILAGKGTTPVLAAAVPVPATSGLAVPTPSSAPGSGWTPNSKGSGFVQSGAGDSHRKRWVIIGLAVAAGAGGALAFRSHGSSPGASNTSGSLPPNIGTPTITIGHP